MKLVFFVPESHKEQVKQAVFEQGAGRYQGYEQCCWETKGLGQFKPMTGSEPFIGEQDQLETVVEYRVEMICADRDVNAVLAALLHSHPYNVPAYEVWPVKTANDF